MLTLGETKGSGGSIELEYKEPQVFHTERNIMMMGVPNNVDRTGLRDMLRPVLVEAKNKMVKKYPDKYDRMIWGRPLPLFEVTRDFVKNGKWEKRDENEDLPVWSKFILYIETSAEDEHIVRGCMEHIHKMGVFQRLFGVHSWVSINPGQEATAAQKSAVSLEGERHAAVMLCLGKIPLPGLILPDRKMPLSLNDDEVGEREDVERSVRDIMCRWKKDGQRIFQCIGPNGEGGWDAYYANGQGCRRFKEIATDWSGAPGAHFRFHCLGRGVEEESLNTMTKKCFTQQAALEAVTSKLVDGKVMTTRQASTFSILAKMEGKHSFVNIEAGMPRLRRLEYQEEKKRKEEKGKSAGAEDSALGPENPMAYNFQDEPSVGKGRSDSSTVYTQNDDGTMGGTNFEPPDDESAYSSEDMWGDDDSSDGESDKDQMAFENIERGRKDDETRGQRGDEMEEEKGDGNVESGSEENKEGSILSVTNRATTSSQQKPPAKSTAPKMQVGARKPVYTNEDTAMSVANAMLGINKSHARPPDWPTATSNSVNNNININTSSGEKDVRELMAEVERLTALLASSSDRQTTHQSDAVQRQTNPSSGTSQQSKEADMAGKQHAQGDGAAARSGHKPD